MPLFDVFFAGFSCSKPSKRCEICSSKISPWETCVVATLTMMVSKLVESYGCSFFMYKLYLELQTTSCISKWLFQVPTIVHSTFLMFKIRIVFFLRTRRRGGKSPEDDGQSGGCYRMHLRYWQDLRAGGSCE